MNCTSRIKLIGTIVAGLLFCGLSALGQGVTIHVDAANTEGPWDGSEANPWQTIGDAVDHLAIVNDDVQGGHTVLVAAGSYDEHPVFTSVHAGLADATNVLQAAGYVRLKELTLNGMSHMKLDGFNFNLAAASPFFTITGGARDVTIENCLFSPPSSRIWIDVRNLAGNRFVFRSCTFRSPYEHAGIRHGGGVGQHITVEGCVFVSGLSGGIKLDRVGSELTLKNSILAGNRSYGMRMISGTKVNAYDNLFYGNGNGVNVYFGATGKAYRTEEDFAELSGHADMNFVNTIVANPGFAGLHDGWNLNLFYENSPALKENSGLDRDIGLYQNPPTVPVLENTYYVNATGGDDDRTPAEAQNANTPWLTIAKAAEHAIAGDTVLVQPGVYSANAIMMTNSGSGNLPVRYLADGDVTVEVTGNTGFHLDRVFGVILDGFKMTGQPTGWSGASIRIDRCAGVTVQNFSISGFVAGSGTKSGLWARNRSADIVLRDSKVYGGDYGVNDNGSSTLIERCLIYGNNVGINTPNPQSRVVNSAIYDNGMNIYGGWFRYYDEVYDARIENCVVAGAGTTGIHSHRQAIDLINTVIYGNTQYGAFEENDGRAVIRVSYSAFHDNGVHFRQQDTTDWQTEEELNAIAGWSENIVADPLFADAAFRLSPESPCIDAGTPTTELETDFFGNPRRTGIAVDIGLYEVPPRPSMIIIR